MSFSHADYARAIRQTLPATADRLAFLTRNGKFHPRLERECLAALERCAEHHEALAAQERAQRAAESRMEDIAAAEQARLEARHGH